MFLIDPANALGRFLEFIDNDFRDDQLEAPGFDLGEKLPARRVDARIEHAAIDGGIGINADGHAADRSGPVALTQSRPCS